MNHEAGAGFHSCLVLGWKSMRVMKYFSNNVANRTTLCFAPSIIVI